MNGDILVRQLLALCLLGSALISSTTSRAVLPEQFLRDDAHIRAAILDPGGATSAESFRHIGAFYRGLGLGELPPLAALLGVGLFIAAVIIALPLESLGRLGLAGFGLLAVSCVFAVVYLGQYTKEIFTVVIALLVLVLPRSPYGDVAVVASCLLYGIYMRPYWLLIAVLYVCIRVLLARRTGPLGMLVCVVAGYAVLAVAFRIVLGENLEGRRTWLNAERADTVVNTLISGPFPEATGVLSVISVLCVLAMLIVPWPLLFSGSPELVLAGIAVMAVWGLVLYTAFSRRRSTVRLSGPPRIARGISLLLALVLVQALFEPDYGSYLKHLTGLLPLVLCCLPLRGNRAPAATVVRPQPGPQHRLPFFTPAATYPDPNTAGAWT